MRGAESIIDAMRRFIFPALFLLLALPVEAHFNGSSWEEIKGEYLVDVGYDAESFVAGEYVRFDFSLKDAPAQHPEDFAEVWVRVVSAEEGTRLATGVRRQPIGPTTLLYVFDRAGAYSLEVSFRDENGKDLATSSMPVAVTGSGAAVVLWPVAAGAALAAGIAGFVLGAFICRRKSPLL